MKYIHDIYWDIHDNVYLPKVLFNWTDVRSKE